MSEPRRAAHGDSAPSITDDEPTTINPISVPKRAGRHPFTRALLATAASTVVPGSGLVTAEKRWARIVGWVAALGFIGGIALIAIRAATGLRSFAALAVQTTALHTIAIALVIVALVWVALIVGTHLIRRPPGITRTQRTVGAFAVGGLSLLVSAPLAVAARYAYAQSNLVSTVFADEDSTSQTRATLEGKTTEDIWANKPRLNVLLLGGDTDANRIKTIKNRSLLTDTIMVASIDTKTGEIALIQVPRNMARTPFPAGTKLRQYYPRGFYDGRSGATEEYMVNAIWNNVPKEHPDAIGPSDYPGADALKLGIGEALGLPIDYFALLNIDGLQQLIDAMGGVTVNINERLPIAGSSERPQDTTGWLKPGPNQHLDGYNAMWYARSRWNTDDFSRMSRQSCLVNAIVKQMDPVTVLTRYEAIAQASSQMVMTDIPQSALPAMVDLALRVKSGNMKRVMFQHGVNGYNTENPDFDMMRARVQAALTPSVEIATPSPEPSQAPTTTAPTATPSKTSKATTPPATQKPSATPTTEASVTDACAYNPKK